MNCVNKNGNNTISNNIIIITIIIEIELHERR